MKPTHSQLPGLSQHRVTSGWLVNITYEYSANAMELLTQPAIT
jgi:hypothetical protein